MEEPARPVRDLKTIYISNASLELIKQLKPGSSIEVDSSWNESDEFSESIKPKDGPQIYCGFLLADGWRLICEVHLFMKKNSTSEKFKLWLNAVDLHYEENPQNSTAELPNVPINQGTTIKESTTTATPGRPRMFKLADGRMVEIKMKVVTPIPKPPVLHEAIFESTVSKILLEESKSEQSANTDSLLMFEDGETLRLLKPMGPSRKPITSDDLAKKKRPFKAAKSQFLVSPLHESLLDELMPSFDIKEHIIEADDSPNIDRRRDTMRCRYCKQQLFGNLDFRKHMKKHPEVDYKPWKCPLCDYKTAIKSGIRKHINIHSDVKAYRCSECGKGFNFKQKLQQHMKYHQDIRDFYCPHCPLSFHELKTLKSHVQKLHHVENPTKYLKTVPYRMPTNRHKAYSAQHNKLKNKFLRHSQQHVKSDLYMNIEEDSESLDASDNQADIEDDSVHILCEDDSGIVQISEDTLNSNVDNTEIVKTLPTDSQINILIQDDSVATQSGTHTYAPEVHVIAPTDDEHTVEHTADDKGQISLFEDSETQVVFQQETEEDIKTFVLRDNIVYPVGVQTETGGVRVDLLDNSGHSQAVEIELQDNELVEDSLPDNVQEVVVAYTLQNTPVSGDGHETTTENSQHSETLAESSSLRPKRLSKLIGTKKIAMGTFRYKEGISDKTDKTKEPKEQFYNSPRMKKVTDLSQIELGLRPYVVLRKAPDGDVMFACKLCTGDLEVVVDLYTKFLQHISVAHPDVKPFHCPQCDHKCRSKANLISHRKTHKGERKYACPICGKSFLFKQKLTVHLRAHKNLREHVCQLCRRGFNEKADMNRHFRKVHMRERTVTCAVCKKKFYDHTDLRRHMESHVDTKMYQCKYCHKCYQTRVSLSQHVKSHTCLFHCEICARDFGSYSGFMAHKVMHDESSEGYHCKMCDKKIMTKGSMKRHLLICHNEYRPYDCPHCYKTYKSKKDFKNHQLSHIMAISKRRAVYAGTSPQRETRIAELQTEEPETISSQHSRLEANDTGLSITGGSEMEGLECEVVTETAEILLT